MARGFIRKPSFGKIVGAYRSQWKRFWLRLFTFGAYGSRGMGWFRDPKKAAYNWWYNRTSISVYRLFGGKASRGSCFFAFLCASIFSIFASPVDATRAGVKAHKIRSERKKRAASSQGTRSESTTNRTRSSASSKDTHTSSTTNSYSSTNTSTAQGNQRRSTKTKSTASPRTTYSSTARTTSGTSHSTTQHKTAEKKEVKTVIFKPTEQAASTERTYTPYTYTPIFEQPKVEAKPIVVDEPPKEPDENTPKSTPKHEKDQYIRKRMIIAGSSYCDASVLSKLQIGTYFDLSREPDNPHDKDAVVLTLDGEKIGYVAKKDLTPFTVCLNLRRNIYGVITDIITENNYTKYEYETWFDSTPRTSKFGEQ